MTELRGSTRLDSYVDRYAARTAGMTASEIRALFAVASRPEVVSLAGGMPNISGLPLDVVGAAVSDVVEHQASTALQYGSGQGDGTLREQICEVMRLEGLGGTVIAATEWGRLEESRLALYRKTLEKIRSTDSLALDMPPR